MIISNLGFLGGADTAWDLSYLFYSGKSFDVTSQTTDPYGISFKSDGTKAYALSFTGSTVYQYTLSSAWDVSTASYESKSFDFSTQDSFVRNLFFRDDGLKMYLSGFTGSTVYQYTLSSAWDVSTASYESKSFSVTTQDNSIFDAFFKDDGLKMYAIGEQNDTVYQYTLSSAWDVSTASYASKSFSVNSEDNNPRSVFFKDDGSKMYVLGNQNDKIYQYSLSTDWDVSTASYDSIQLSVNSEDAEPQDAFYRSDGKKLYMIGIQNDKIYQYDT